MLVNSKDAERRLNSPDNLLNRLRRESPRSVSAKNAMSLFVRPDIQPPQPIPAITPSSIYIPSNSEPVIEPEPDKTEDKAAKQVLDDLALEIKRESIHSAALDVLSKSVYALGEKITAGEIGKPKDLADIARKMSGIVTDIKKSGEDNKDKDGKTVHLHFYTPERKKLSDFEVIDVG